MSTRCEDYPCCGHEPGQCPHTNAEGVLVFTCVCGAPLKKNASSSLCDGCLRRASSEEMFEGSDLPPRELEDDDSDEGEGFCMGGMELGSEDWPG